MQVTKARGRYKRKSDEEQQEAMKRQFVQKGVTAEGIKAGQKKADTRHLAPLSPGVEATHRAELARLWAYLELQEPGKGSDILQFGQGALLTLPEIKYYLCTRMQTMRGKPTVRSALDVAISVLSAYRRKTGKTFDREEGLQITAYCRSDLIAEANLQNRPPNRPRAGVKDFFQVVHTSWNEPGLFKSVRDRNQFLAHFFLVTYGCCRPGETSLQATYENVDDLDTLCYKDLDFRLAPDKDNKDILRVKIKIKVRNMKGKRMTSDQKEIVFVEEDIDQAPYDPTNLFVALALEDKAFEKISSTRDLDQFTVGDAEKQGGHIPLKINKEMLEIPLFRNIERIDGDWRTNKAYPASYYSFALTFRKIMRRRGYTEGTYYAFRRFMVDLLERKGVNDANIRHLVGHNQTSWTFLKVYKANVCTEDVSSLLRGLPSRGDRREEWSGLDRDVYRPEGVPLHLAIGHLDEQERTEMQSCHAQIQEIGALLKSDPKDEHLILQYGHLHAKKHALIKKGMNRAKATISKEARDRDFRIALSRRDLQEATPELSSGRSEASPEVLPETPESNDNPIPIDPVILAEEACQPAWLCRVKKIPFANSECLDQNQIPPMNTPNSDNLHLLAEPSTSYQPTYELNPLAGPSSYQPTNELNPLAGPSSYQPTNELNPLAGPSSYQPTNELDPLAGPTSYQPTNELDPLAGPSSYQPTNELDPLAGPSSYQPTTASHGQALFELQVEVSEEIGNQQGLEEEEADLLGLGPWAKYEQAMQTFVASTDLPYKPEANGNPRESLLKLVEKVNGEPSLDSRGALLDTLLLDSPFLAHSFPNPGESPGPRDTCPVISCDASKPTSAHIHTCINQKLGEMYWDTFVANAHLADCPFTSCKEGPFAQPSDLTKHLNDHCVRNFNKARPTPCDIIKDGSLCGYLPTSHPDMNRHIEAYHLLVCTYKSIDLKNRIRYCEDCSLWIRGSKMQDEHAQGHLSTDLITYKSDPQSCVTLFFGTKERKRELKSRIKCPFCLFNEDLAPAQRWFSVLTKRKKHILECHLDIVDDLDAPLLTCPWPQCLEKVSPVDLADHLQEYHHIRLQDDIKALTPTLSIKEDPASVFNRYEKEGTTGQDQDDSQEEDPPEEGIKRGKRKGQVYKVKNTALKVRSGLRNDDLDAKSKAGLNALCAEEGLNYLRNGRSILTGELRDLLRDYYAGNSPIYARNRKWLGNQYRKYGIGGRGLRSPKRIIKLWKAMTVGGCSTEACGPDPQKDTAWLEECEKQEKEKNQGDKKDQEKDEDTDMEGDEDKEAQGGS